MIGPETQAVLRTLQQRLSETGQDEEQDDAEVEKPGGLLAFDPADREAVERFQREHGLQPDGYVGPLTQAALRAAMADQEQELMARPARRRERPSRAGVRPRRRALLSGMPLASSLPESDRELESELADAVEALRRTGPMSRQALAKEVNARLWGPGRLRYVLRAGEEAGVLRRSGRDRWSAA